MNLSNKFRHFVNRQQFFIKLVTNHQISCSHYGTDNKVTIRSLLPYKTDSYAGIHFEIINQDKVNNLNVDLFHSLVQDEINTQNDCRTIWFRISETNVHLLEPLIKLGFRFHHTKTNYVVVVKPLTVDNNIPKYAYTNIGVGSLVVNEKNEVLMVKEKHYLVKQWWKLPGGYVEQGEDLNTAAMREVFEETGIKTEFVTILLMRHFHKFTFDCSDMYFVCLLKPVTNEIINCKKEIFQCEWRDLNEVKGEFNKIVLNSYVKWKNNPVKFSGEVLTTPYPQIPQYTMYTMKDDELNRK